MVIVVSALGALVVAIAAFSHNIVLGLFVLVIIAPLIFLFYVILYRVFLEVVMAVFTIAENTTALVGASRPPGAEPPPWPSPPPGT